MLIPTGQFFFAELTMGSLFTMFEKKHPPRQIATVRPFARQTDAHSASETGPNEDRSASPREDADLNFVPVSIIVTVIHLTLKKQ